MTDKAHRTAARDAMFRQFGDPTSKGSPPIVTWRCTERCILLRVYLTPEGWVLDGQDFKVPMDEWVRRTTSEGQVLGDVEQSLETYREGKWAAFNPRQVDGIQKVMPLDLDQWEHARFEVGCRHGHGHQHTADLAEDCSTMRATRRAVMRSITHPDHDGM